MLLSASNWQKPSLRSAFLRSFDQRRGLTKTIKCFVEQEDIFLTVVGIERRRMLLEENGLVDFWVEESGFDIELNGVQTKCGSEGK